MRSVLCLLAFIAVPAVAADLLIENVTVVSPERSAPLAKQSVLIRDGRIAQIGAHRIAAPSAQHLDGRGKYLTPGLTDSHVHLTTPSGLPYVSDDPAIRALRDAYFAQQPRSSLYFGITQVFDLANEADGIAAFEAQPQRPDLFRCGAAPVLDGYPTVFVDKPARYRFAPTYIVEPANPELLPEGADPKAHTPEAVVEQIAASGARCVKVFIEDGFGAASDWPILSLATLRRLREAAHKRGLLLIAHANALDMQQIAVATPVDVIAHGLWNWGELDSQPGMPAAIAEHLRRIHAQRIGYQPTVRVLAGTADLFRADTLKDPTYAKVVPPALLDWYATEPGQWFKREMSRQFGGAPDSKVMHINLQVAERGMRAARYLHELGHPLLLGSDTPSSPTYGSQPGYDTYREMRMLAQSGLPPLAVFRAATLHNVRQFKLENDYGTIAVGKIANLLLLTANPLESLHAWSQIDKILLHGEVIERESLAAK